MSLVVWYPFTKDTRNRGLSADATFNGTVNFLSSQFGYGLDLSKGNNVVIPELAGLKTFSISFWVKIFTDISLSTNWVNVFGIWDNNPEDSDSGSFRWQTGYGNPYVTTMGIGGPYNSSEQNICANMGIMTSEKNIWHHICAVVDYENNRVTSYLNGTVKNTTRHNGGHIWTGRMDFGSTNARGVMNDFRIYNHALSMKEIKELSKGLILHHDLKGYGAGENILPLVNLMSGITIEEEGYRGQTVFTRDTTVTTESYLGWGRTGPVEQSTQYTFSCYLWLNDNVESVDIYWLSDTEASPKTGTGWVNVTRTVNISGLIVNQWNYVTWIFTTPADDYTGYIRIDNNGSKIEGEYAILKACCPKLEKGSKATPYILHGLTNTDIEEDLSGNGFNGTRQGVTFTPDSPRYYMSTEFDANKDLILDRIFHQGDEVSNLSVSIWVKFKGDTSNPNIWSLNDSNFIRIEKITNTNKIQIAAYMNNGIQYFKATFNETVEQNKWYHLVLTFDKGIFKFYANNVLINTTDKTSVATALKCLNSTNRWSLGDYNGGNDLVGNLSDFRIYAKTLTANDVTELYKIGAQVDKTGKLYCGELVEE